MGQIRSPMGQIRSMLFFLRFNTSLWYFHVVFIDVAKIRSCAILPLPFSIAVWIMVRNYKRKTIAKYSEDDIADAIKAVKDGATIRKVAASYKIPFSTLRDHIDRPHSTKSGRKTTLTTDEEKIIVKSISYASKCGWPCCRDDLRRMVQKIQIYINNITNIYIYIQTYKDKNKNIYKFKVKICTIYIWTKIFNHHKNKNYIIWI